MSIRYPIPAARHRSEIEIDRSRFIASAAPATTVDAARDFIDEIKAEMPDASHHVYAFVIGHGASVTRGMSDDGEPSGTAGRPTMAVVEGSGLGDLCLVTTRYFGGRKLGTGGLVRAYTQAAQAVLESLPRGLHIETRQAHLDCPYALYEIVQGLLESHQATALTETFGPSIQLHLELPVDQLEPLQSALAEASSGSLRLEPLTSTDTDSPTP